MATDPEVKDYIQTITRGKRARRKTAKVKRYIQRITSKGGKARAQKYSKRQLSRWGKLGGDGRPPEATVSVLNALRAGKRSLAEIAMESGVAVSVVSSLLTRLRRAGKVVRQSRGVWVLNEESSSGPESSTQTEN